jgi:cytochrome c550
MRKLRGVVFVAGLATALGVSAVGWSQNEDAHLNGDPVGQLAPSVTGPMAGTPPLSDADAALLASLLADGQTYFAANCAACHGNDLQGGEGPALASSAALADSGFVVRQILMGGGFMPAFGRLNNHRIAALATYIRNTHDNSFGIVTEEEVAAAR